MFLQLNLLDLNTARNVTESVCCMRTYCNVNFLHLYQIVCKLIIENKSYQLNRIQIHQYLGTTELTFRSVQSADL